MLIGEQKLIGLTIEVSKNGEVVCPTVWGTTEAMFYNCFL